MAVTAQKMMQLMAPARKGAAKTTFQMPSGLSNASEGYYRRVEAYARRIRDTGDVSRIIEILDEALADTRALHHSHAVKLAEEKVSAAEREIEALKAELERAVAMSHLDPLTAMLNRRGLDEAFCREAARSDRHGTPMCAALIDVDDFKALNDSLGHPAGDAALTHLSQLMRTSLRPNDVLARIGGEEFVVLLPDTNEQDAFAALSRLQKAVTSHRIDFGGREFGIRFTASVALRGLGETLPALASRLDATLYLAKNSGKNRVLFAVPG